MKFNGATSVLELQRYLNDNRLDMQVVFVSSARAWRVTIAGGDVNYRGEQQTWIGIGRVIGEAMQNAVDKFEESTRRPA